MKKTIEYVGFALVALLMAAALLTYLAPHLGCRVDAMITGSTDPEIKAHSLLVTRSVNPEDIKAGDFITFRRGFTEEDLITRRVIGITRNSPISFVTGGDADKAGPLMVPSSSVLGKVCLRVPFAGYVTEFLKTKAGFAAGLVLPGLIIITVIIISMWREIAGNRGKQEKVAAGCPDS
jgi:signal peptidase